MEYTFRNSVREESQTITLNDYSMKVCSGNVTATIPYANIINVRLCKTSFVYKMVVYYDADKPLIISNRHVVNKNHIEDQSRLYSTFVRVLHFHLKNKSAAVYTAGCSKDSIWKWGIAGVGLSYIVSFTADYLGFKFFDVYLGAAILACVCTITLFFLNAGQLPKAYTSTDIPLNLLPEA